MLITLEDGRDVVAYDTETGKTIMANMGRHSLRFHIVEGNVPSYRSSSCNADEKFVTADRQMQDKLIGLAAARHGIVDTRNTWVKSKITRKELFTDVTRYKEILLADLRQYFGDLATVGPTSLRYVYYLSDGSMESTPDAIGTKFNHPLVYEGYAIASIFDVNNMGVLNPDFNHVVWLTRPMWTGFHDRKREVHKDFPWPTGFVCTKWCQRIGHAGYGGAPIWIASMTQGQTVGTWAATSLRRYWIENQGPDPFAKIFGKVFSGRDALEKQADFKLMVAANQNINFGKIGAVCRNCGKFFATGHPYYHHCSACDANLESYRYWPEGNYCRTCGRLAYRCDCGGGNTIFMSQKGHHENYLRILEAIKNA